MNDFNNEIKKLLNFLNFPWNKNLLKCLKIHKQHMLNKDTAAESFMNDKLFSIQVRLALSTFELIVQRISSSVKLNKNKR